MYCEKEKQEIRAFLNKRRRKGAMSKKIIKILQYLISIGLILVGSIWSILDYIDWKRHPEWSAAWYVFVLRFLLFLLAGIAVFGILGLVQKSANDEL